MKSCTLPDLGPHKTHQLSDIRLAEIEFDPSGTVDFRYGIDGLSGLCEHILKQNPRSGTLFVFINRDKTKIRILVYENNGFWLMTKRMSGGKFRWPKIGEAISNVQATELRKILAVNDN